MPPHLAALLLLAAVLAGCTDPAAAPPGAAGLEIADVMLNSRTITAAQHFGVTFKIRQPGSGKLAAYGLATRLGEQRFALRTPLPVIANGAAELTAVGPLPNQTEAGRFTVSFWVEDERGATSNRLTTELTIQ